MQSPYEYFGIGRSKLASDFESIKRAYVMGETSLRIADRYGVSYQTVVKLLRDHGVNIRPSASGHNTPMPKRTHIG